MEPDISMIGDRRRGKKDYWMVLLRWFAIFGWLLVLAALFFIGKARPRRKSFFDHVLDVKITPATWDEQMLFYFFMFMLLGFFLSVVGLFINIRRHRRKTDEYRVSLVILGLISFCGIIKYLLF